MSIGKWIVYSDDGLFENWENGSYLFSTKKEAINQLTAAYLDNRKHSTIKRISKGQYVYDVPDCDCKNIRHFVYIEKITKQNIGKFKELSNDVDTEER